MSTGARIGWIIGACLCAAACSTDKAPIGGAALGAGPCTNFSFPIYFEKNSDQLTGPAHAVLDSSGARARACKVTKVEVLGLADADGTAQHNLALSRRRAEIVAQALATYGLPRPAFDIDALGEAGARAVDGKPEPLRRRTEVVIHAEPK